jgi:hypothetical protein
MTDMKLLRPIQAAVLTAMLAAAMGMATALALVAPPARAVDLTVLDTPGAVHLPPGTTGVSRAPKSAFSFSPLISQAEAASASGSGAPAGAITVPAVRLTGMFMPGDSAKMNDVLTRLAASPEAQAEGPLTTIELSSMGGNLLEGFEIGTMLRKFNVLAVVRQHDLCLSSCALALLGGNVHSVPQAYPTHCNVEIGGKVGFHNFFLNPAGLRESTPGDPVASRLQGFADARGGAASLVRYAADMGLPSTFVASLIGRPVEDFQYIETIEQFLSLGVCPVGLTRPAISLEEQADNICDHSLGRSDQTLAFEARPLPAAQTKRYLLEVMQAHMQPTRSHGRLAGMLANGAVMRVAGEIDRLYEDLQSVNVALPDIVGPTFEISIVRPGRLEPACYVSLSPDDPDKFDVVLVGQKGFSDPVRMPPANARRLFLFARDTVVNRRPYP